MTMFSLVQNVQNQQRRDHLIQPNWHKSKPINSPNLFLHLLPSFFLTYIIYLLNIHTTYDMYLPPPWYCINILQFILQSSSFSQCKLYLVLIGLFDVSHTILRSSPRMMLLFDISTITHPNIQGNLNVHHSLIFSDEEWLAIFPANNTVGPVESFYFNQAPPLNSSRYHLPASSSFTTSDFHYPPCSTCQPTTSSSWQSLANVQLGLYQRRWLPHSKYQSWTQKWCFNSGPNSWTLPETVQELSSTALWQRYSRENSDSGHSF